jgi:S-DNA-T family DNA segregation ATPase FtsK/SpoIIIE
VSSIDAFWGRPAIFEQFVLRIALPRARRILDQKNDAALHLPRWHAVINHESGMRHGDRVVRVPNASEPGTVDDVQTRLYEEFKDRFSKPRLFDGSLPPVTEDLLARLPQGGPVAMVGQLIDVDGSPALVRLPAVPGRNLVVLGPGSGDAVRMLDAAGGGLAATIPPGEADVVLAALVPDAGEHATALGKRFTAKGHAVCTVALDGFAAQLRELSAELTRRLAGGSGRATAVVLYAADAADAILDRTGTDDLRRLIHYGPEVGVHVIGWWRSVPRMRSLLMMGASVDDIGAWVALDVQGAELQPLLPGPLLNWSPRPGRGLWFDRAQHATPEVVIVPAPKGRP